MLNAGEDEDEGHGLLTRYESMVVKANERILDLGPNLSDTWALPTAMSAERVRVRVCLFYSLIFAISNKHKVQGLSIFRPVIYGNSATALPQKERDVLASPDHSHRWTVAVRSAASEPDTEIVGGADDLSYFIKRVTFKLHDTYANPTRSKSPPTKFEDIMLTLFRY